MDDNRIINAIYTDYFNDFGKTSEFEELTAQIEAEHPDKASEMINTLISVCNSECKQAFIAGFFAAVKLLIEERPKE